MQHDEDPDAQFGSSLRAARVEAGFTQRQLAAELADFGLALDPSAITRMEQGKRAVRLSEAKKIADFFDMTVSSMLQERDTAAAITDLRRHADRHMHEARQALALWVERVGMTQAHLRRDPEALSAAFASDASPDSAETYLIWFLGRLKAIDFSDRAGVVESAADAELLRDAVQTLVRDVVQIDPEFYGAVLDGE